MALETTILALPLIEANQAQKHIPHNEALRLLDVVVQLAVASRTLTTPPPSPSLGARYIVAAGASGAWAGQSGKIAFFSENGWEFVTPLTGWYAYIAAEAQLAIFNGTGWEVPSGSGGPSNPPMLGINAVPDATNRLSVSAPATLFSHEGAGHQLKVNKALAGDNACLLFQTGFSGRAELGTMGGDDFTLKVSPTGSGFTEALRVSSATGAVSLPEGATIQGLTLQDGADPSKEAQFSLAGLSPSSLRSYTLPDASGEVALLSGAQDFTGAKSFSGGLSCSGAAVFSGAVTLSGAVTFAVTAADLGTATGSATYTLGGGATLAGETKTLGLGTGGLSGSTTSVTIGSSVAGALGSLTIHSPSVTFSALVSDVAMSSSKLTVQRIGIGTAASPSHALALSGATSQLTHDGAGHKLLISKIASAETAAVQFQSGGSGRAEMGLLGSNDFTIALSSDGSSYQTALTATPDGAVTLHKPVLMAAQSADPASPATGTFWWNSTSGQLKLRGPSVTRVLDAQMDVPFLVPPTNEYVLTTNGAGGAAASTLAGAANRFDLYPYLPRADLTLNQLVVNCTTAVASAQGKLVLYSADALGRPDALILETAVLDLGTTGAKVATVSLSLQQGLTYWIGIRHSSTATLSAWAATATPDINGGTAISTSARKVLRRTLTFATAAPSSWGFLSSEINPGPATAIWMRMA